MRPSISIAQLFALTAICAVAISAVRWLKLEPFDFPYLLVAALAIRLAIRRLFRCSRGVRDFLIGWTGTTTILVLMILVGTSRSEPSRWIKDIVNGSGQLAMLYAIGVSTLVEMMLPSWLTVREAT